MKARQWCSLSYLLFFSFMLTDLAMANVKLSQVSVDLHDQASLQRGARIFMNYCSGCHSLRYMRYNRMGQDLGLTKFAGHMDNTLLVNNLIFTTAEVEDPIEISMPATDARRWFGIVPPDLSLKARERGPAWIYTYLKSFYSDKNRPFGANNLLLPDVAMPNSLEPLQGTVIAEHRHDVGGLYSVSLKRVQQGEMNEEQFDRALKDLVTFLVYVAEPVKLVRYRMGLGVILFLCILIVVAYQLRQLYWRNR